MSSKRVRLISLTGIILIALIIGVSLIVNHLSKDTREVPLPDPNVSGSPDDTPDGPENNGLEHVVVTKDNVQDVIATLVRPDFYTRTVEIVKMYEGGSTVFSIGTHTAGSAAALKISSKTNSPGVTEHVVIDGGKIFIWYDGDKTPYVRPVDATEDEKKSSDAYQMIMSYEDVLELEKNSITDAGYMIYGDSGEKCIYVQYVTELLHYNVKCYISVDSGLLIHAEMFDGDKFVYKMTTSGFDRSEPHPSVFELPDGSNPISDP